MPQYYKLSVRSKKTAITNPDKCPASVVHSPTDQRYPAVHTSSYHRYPPVHPLGDPRFSPVHPQSDPRYPVHPVRDPTYPVIERNVTGSFTRKQFLYHLWAVEKSRDRRRQHSMQKNSGHCSQITEVQGQDRKRPVQSRMTNEVPTVGRQAACGDLNSGPEKAWTQFYHWENSQRSVEANSTDKRLSTHRPEHEATEDHHKIQICTPTASTTSKVVPSSSHSSRLPSITNSDHPMTTQTRKPTLHVPSVLLPRIYTLTPRPLQYREFLTCDKLSVPITDDVWEELKHCRYIRHAAFGGPRQGQR